MKRLLQGFIAFLLFGSITFAQSNYPRDVTLCWTHPTLYEDGTTIEDGDLRGTFIHGERQNLLVILDEEVPITGVPGSMQCQTFVGAIPQPGTYTFTAFAITVDDISSDASNAAIKKYTGKPLPPEGLGVQ